MSTVLEPHVERDLVEPMTEAQRPTFSWAKKPEVIVLLVLVLAVYFSRLTDLSIRGEEPRRATIAWEILRTGDWIVPRQQGEPFLSRPPLGNWLIAVTALIRGQCDLMAVRLPTVLATLLTVLIIYGYSLTFLSRLGAFAAAAAYATMIQVLELGRLAETEAVFTLLLGGGLLVWHWGHARGWRPGWVWLLGYLLAALATLAKGPQAPVYFVGSVVVFLVVQGQWRFLVSWAHLLGLFIFGLLVGTWMLLFYQELGWEAARQIWTGDTAMRFEDTSFETVVAHLASYPIEVLACTMPWSLMLLVFLDRSLRRSLRKVRSHVLFLLVCLLVAFPTCWLVPGARPRYLMPLYPCLAPLIGLAIERCTSATASATLARMWRNYRLALASGMCLAGCLIGAASFLPLTVIESCSQPPLFALAYVALALLSAGLVVWAGRFRGPLPAGATVLAVACFLGMTATGVALNYQAQKSVATEEEMAALKAGLPVGRLLVSLGPVHHCFAYHFQDPIELVLWPRDDSKFDEGIAYFCFDSIDGEMLSLPFAWEIVGTVCCDRYRSEQPKTVVVVGRRLSSAAAYGP